MDWLRRVIGAGAARETRPTAPAEPQPAVQRKRDELTTAIRVDAPEQTVIAGRREPASTEETVQARVGPEPIEPTTPVPDPEPAPDFQQIPERQPEPVAPPEPSAGSRTPPVTKPISAPDPPKVEPVPAPPASAPHLDPEATLALEPQAQDPEATLYLRVPKRVVATLEAVKGELQGQRFALYEGENRMGRSPESDVVLPSMWISRAHATVICNAGQISIVSLSDKITSVNGETVSTEKELTDGCNVQLGGTVFQLRVES